MSQEFDKLLEVAEPWGNTSGYDEGRFKNFLSFVKKNNFQPPLTENNFIGAFEEANGKRRLDTTYRYREKN